MNTQHGWTIWLTGLPASGKTTIARALQQKLRQRGTNAVLLDSDEVRRVVTPHPSYTPEERDFFYGALVGLAQVLTVQNFNVIIAATGNRRAYRDDARTRLTRFIQVWVQCPLDVCRARDPKGLYAQSDMQKSMNLPGAGAIYEPPQSPDVIVDTTIQSPESAANQIIAQCTLDSA